MFFFWNWKNYFSARIVLLYRLYMIFSRGQQNQGLLRSKMVQVAASDDRLKRTKIFDIVEKTDEDTNRY